MVTSWPWTVTMNVFWPVTPSLSVTPTVTVYTPGLVYGWLRLKPLPVMDRGPLPELSP